ncbi:MAG: YggS family pyridoxal phosphate-dependent enzyme [Gemmataceae bacterium]
MLGATERSVLADRLAVVEARIAAACVRAGRPRDSVTLVAVTKYTSLDVAATLLDLGVLDLGESRPQALWERAVALPAARWHLIGHLQRNKVERTLPLTQLIHSVDSRRLLDAIEAEGRPCSVLLEFNISGEAQKHGFVSDDVPALVGAIHELKNVRVRGLMGMAAIAEDPEASRPAFAALRHLRDRLHTGLDDAQSLVHLSMGMSQDFEVAIEEGATLVRVGSTLVEGLV